MNRLRALASELSARHTRSLRKRKPVIVDVAPHRDLQGEDHPLAICPGCHVCGLTGVIVNYHFVISSQSGSASKEDLRLVLVCSVKVGRSYEYHRTYLRSNDGLIPHKVLRGLRTGTC